MIPSAGKTTWAEKESVKAQVSCPKPLPRQGDLGYQAGPSTLRLRLQGTLVSLGTAFPSSSL